jgi:hypothetical protein
VGVVERSAVLSPILTNPRKHLRYGFPARDRNFLQKPMFQIKTWGIPLPSSKGQGPPRKDRLGLLSYGVFSGLRLCRAENTAFGVSLIHSIWLLQFGPIEGFFADARTATFNLERWFVRC